jgi:hypothetical protein
LENARREREGEGEGGKERERKTLRRIVTHACTMAGAGFLPGHGGEEEGERRDKEKGGREKNQKGEEARGRGVRWRRVCGVY